jgi:hypothetical protein
MIQEILYIQNTRPHLSLDARTLIDRYIKSQQVMNMSTLTAYLYGAQEDTNQRNISALFQ